MSKSSQWESRQFSPFSGSAEVCLEILWTMQCVIGDQSTDPPARSSRRMLVRYTKVRMVIGVSTPAVLQGPAKLPDSLSNRRSARQALYLEKRKLEKSLFFFWSIFHSQLD